MAPLPDIDANKVTLASMKQLNAMMRGAKWQREMEKGWGKRRKERKNLHIIWGTWLLSTMQFGINVAKPSALLVVVAVDRTEPLLARLGSAKLELALTMALLGLPLPLLAAFVVLALLWIGASVGVDCPTAFPVTKCFLERKLGLVDILFWLCVRYV